MLMDSNVDVLEATTLQEADAIATRESRLDIIILDLVMPGMNGLDASRAIRALGGERGHMPILAMTADLSQSVKQKAGEVGINDLLGKPYDWQMIQAALNRWGGSGERPRGKPKPPPRGTGEEDG